VHMGGRDPGKVEKRGGELQGYTLYISYGRAPRLHMRIHLFEVKKGYKKQSIKENEGFNRKSGTESSRGFVGWVENARNTGKNEPPLPKKKMGKNY